MRVALKIDVDTYHGLGGGVPRMLDALSRRGILSSFFVAMGRDNSGKAIRRFFTQKGFARKMLRSGAARLYGFRTALYGTLLPAPEIARSFPEHLRRVIREGHELGVHGHDHVTWHDRLLLLRDADVDAEIDRALAVFDEVVGAEPAGFAAPGWQCSAAAIARLDRGPFAYHSSTRGRRPYRPRIDGVDGRLPELPTTAPTLDELLGLGLSEGAALERLLDGVEENELNVLTLHAEVEGGPCLGVFEALLDRLAERARFERLVDAARALQPSSLPVVPVVQSTRPGRAGTVSCAAG